MELKAALEKVDELIAENDWIGNGMYALGIKVSELVTEIYRRNEPAVANGPGMNQSTAIPLDAVLYQLQPGDGSTYNFALWPTPKTVSGCKNVCCFTLCIFGYDNGCGEILINDDRQYIGYLQGHGFKNVYSKTLAVCVIAARCLAHDTPLADVLAAMLTVESRLSDGCLDLRGL